MTQSPHHERHAALPPFECDCDVARRPQIASCALTLDREAASSVLYGIPDAMVTLDASWRVTFANPAFEALVGQSVLELLDRTIWEVVPDIDPTLAQALQTTMEERTAVEMQWFSTACDRWHDVRVFPSMNGVSLIARDITRQVQAEQALLLRERRFDALLQHQSDVIGIVAPDGLMLYQSASLGRILGYEPHEFDGQNGFSFVHPDDVPRLVPALSALVTVPGAHAMVEYRVRCKNGSYRWFESIMTNLVDVAEVGGIVLNTRDVTERKHAEEGFRALVENAADLIMRYDRELRVTYVNPVIERTTGVPAAFFIGKTIAELGVSQHLHEQWANNLRQVLETGIEVMVTTEAPLLGETRMFQARMTPEFGADGTVEAVLAIVRDCTEQHTLETQLRYHALHDPVTGLANRDLLMDRITVELAQSHRSGQPVVVLFLDLDNFKLVNDCLGHEAGDRFLCRVAARLQAAVRAGDTVARFGGDEFAILLHAMDGPTDISRLADRLLTTLNAPFDDGNQQITLSASIGIAMSTAATRDAGELLRHADIAMYHAKELGKNRFALFDTDLADMAARRLSLEHALRQAIALDEFVVHYQPKVALDTEQVIGLEALVRWRHPERGLVPPMEFIPVAEETGLIVPIGERVLRAACRQFRAWQDAAIVAATTHLSVNLSARQFRQATLVSMITEVLAETGLDGANLVLEITESAVMRDPEQAVSQLCRLKELGITVSIDDFGTGYSSLAYLKRFPVDVLKIDRSFVQGLGVNPEDAAIVAATINLGHALNLRLVAEGIETHEQVAHLRAMGCEVGQGYLFSRPEPADRVAALLATWPQPMPSIDPAPPAAVAAN